MAGLHLLLFGVGAFAGDLTCYGYTSTTSHFNCNYPVGNCTWWAAYKRPDLAAAGITGDAKYWYDNASKLGFSVGSEPKDGAIAVFSSPSHVAYVENENGGTFSVSEMDATGLMGNGVLSATYYPDGNNKYHRNNGASGGWTLKGFIYAFADPTPKTGQSINAAKSGSLAWTPANVECQNATRWYRVMGNGELELIADSFRQIVYPPGVCAQFSVTATCKP